MHENGGLVVVNGGLVCFRRICVMVVWHNWECFTTDRKKLIGKSFKKVYKK